MTTKELYIVRWKRLITDKEDHGLPISFDAATKAVEYGDRKYPDINHWTEKVSHPPTSIN